MKYLTEIKPYTSKELACYYGIGDRLLEKWLVPFRTEIGERIGWYYNVNQVRMILDKLGMPCSVEDCSKMLSIVLPLWMAA